MKVVIWWKINFFLKRLIWVKLHCKVTCYFLYKHTNFIQSFFHIFEKSIFLFLVVLRGHNLRFNEGQNFRVVKKKKKLRKTWYKALITGESNAKHVLSTHRFIFEKVFPCSRNWFFYVFLEKKNHHLCVWEIKCVKILKCSFRHNTSTVRSKNWWNGRGEAMQPFLQV